MIALARAGPTPGNLSSSSAEAELMSTKPPGCWTPVAGRDCTVGGTAGDLDGDGVCATAGIANNRPNPSAPRQRATLISPSPLSARSIAGGRLPVHTLVERDHRTRQPGPGEAVEHRRGQTRQSTSTICSGPKNSSKPPRKWPRDLTTTERA